MSFDATFGVQVSGRAGAEERGPARDNGTFPESASIFACDSDEITLEINMDGGEVNIGMSVYHAKDYINERVFHSRISCDIAISDIDKLHAFLGFLLTSMSKDKA